MSPGYETRVISTGDSLKGLEYFNNVHTIKQLQEMTEIVR